MPSYREFTATSLWRSTFGQTSNDAFETACRERLRSSFLQFRERSGHLAAEIARSYPDLTVHDITHLDALWEVASVLCGPAYEISPPEAFVLGGAFLIHDLGNGASAYIGGPAAIAQTVQWRDAFALEFRRSLGRPPFQHELATPPPDLARKATESALRLLHASQAATLLQQEWPTADGARYRLITDDELREFYGHTIGQIAASHWWPAAALPKQLRPAMLAAPAWLPAAWTVDTVKVAAILRVADACHLDTRRAPAFLRALRQPRPSSDAHWVFQSHLSQPMVDGNELVFTAGRPFPATERDAWWLCYDTLQMVDRELRATNILLRARSHINPTCRPLQAQSVRGSEHPEKLADNIPTSNWHPVDAKIHVGNVRRLVERLGGSALYGDDPLIPIRELIQNGADSVRARRALGGHGPTAGRVTIRRLLHDGSESLEVEDDGVGMSELVLTRHLLDFSSSFWSEPTVMEEHPGLAATAFEPTGQYGIGFFSVFMLAEHIEITTRRYDEALQQTRVLEFRAGLNERPYLRPATAADNFVGPGTRVRLHLGTRGILERMRDNRSKDSLAAIIDRMSPEPTLLSLIQRLAPTLDVGLSLVDEGREINAIEPSDWVTLPAAELVSRTCDFITDRRADDGLTLIYSDGRPVGRCALSPAYSRGLVTVGGLAAAMVTGISGVLIGTSLRADRRSAAHLVPPSAVAPWANEQAKYWGDAPPADQCKIAALVHILGGQTGALKIARFRGQYYSADELIDVVNTLHEVVIAEDAIPEALMDELPEEQIRGIVRAQSPFHARWLSTGEMYLTVFSRAWRMDPEQLRRRAEFDTSVSFVGEDAGEDIEYHLFSREPADDEWPEEDDAY